MLGVPYSNIYSVLLNQNFGHSSAKCILVTGSLQEHKRSQSVNIEASISGENQF
jgi:hypothetical protein